MFHNCKNEKEIKKLFRSLASFLHPDKGGEGYLMILLQEAKELAVEAVKGYESFKKETTKHEKTYEDVDAGDERLSIICEIKKYGEKHKSFSTDFVESVEEYLEEHGYVTSSQFNSLVKVYYSFRMDKKND